MEQFDPGFSDDETFALYLGLALGLVPFFFWYKALLLNGKFGAPKQQRIPLYLVPPFGLMFLEYVLLRYADPVVRADGDYQWLFLFLALVWLNAARFLTPFLGISITGDVIERNNPAAVIALSGAFTAVLIIYTGANIGSGPTIWTTLLPAFLGTAALFGFWLVLELVGHPSAAITEDRDVAAGLRLAGFLLAMAVNLAYAVAGNWVSLEDTIFSFARHMFPALLLLFIAVGFEKKLKPTPQAPQQPLLSHGIIPFAVQALISAAVVFMVRG